MESKTFSPASLSNFDGFHIDLSKIESHDNSYLRNLFDELDEKPCTTVECTDGLKSSHKSNTCSTCESTDILEDVTSGYTVCKRCGQVLDSILDANPEWRGFDEDGRCENTRCSMPINPLLSQSSLGTSIGGAGFRSRIKRIHNWSVMPYRERSLNDVFRFITEKCRAHRLLKCIEDDAKIMYKTISDVKHNEGKNSGKYIIVRGVNRTSLIAACVFFACKKKQMTRSTKEIAEMFGLDNSEMTQGNKLFMEYIRMASDKSKSCSSSTIFDYSSSSQPEHFIVRFCNQLCLKKNFIDEALDLVMKIKYLKIATTHTPFSVAITCILMVAQKYDLVHINKKLLANMFCVSEVTINKTMRKIELSKDKLWSCTIKQSEIEEYLANPTKFVSKKIPKEIEKKFIEFEIPFDMNPNKELDVIMLNKQNMVIETELGREYVRQIKNSICRRYEEIKKILEKNKN